MIRFYHSNDPIHNRVIRALYAGCDEEKAITHVEDYKPSDVAVVFGIRKSKVPISFPRGHIIAEQRRRGLDVIVLETGYLRRGDDVGHYYAAGWNGLNGRADFRNADSPPDRFDALGIEVKPWRVDGYKIIVCGQVPWDASVDHLDYAKWRSGTLGQLTGNMRKVIYREHPAMVPGGGKPLAADLKDAWAVVTCNSNSAVEAAVAGIPVFATDQGSMAWPIANKDLRNIDNPAMPERRQWLNNLAYCQWSLPEMESGLTWAHLSRSPVPA